MQLNEYITWRCKKNEQEGEKHRHDYGWLDIPRNKNIKRKNKIFFCGLDQR
jgi:hypothetical protein